VPLLTDALASLECEIVAEHPAGDHSIVVGRVDDLRVAPEADPLVFYAGAFREVLSYSESTVAIEKQAVAVPVRIAGP
jgi:flavin reductase (DIM6/NTAB) family NADH-FMN oxidoreductase RutF